MIKLNSMIDRYLSLSKQSEDIEDNVELVEYGLNSIDFIKLIIAIESEYNIEVDEEYLLIEKLGSKEKIFEYIESKTNECI